MYSLNISLQGSSRFLGLLPLLWLPIIQSRPSLSGGPQQSIASPRDPGSLPKGSFPTRHTQSPLSELLQTVFYQNVV